jgi:hypothetical protein
MGGMVELALFGAVLQVEQDVDVTESFELACTLPNEERLVAGRFGLHLDRERTRTRLIRYEKIRTRSPARCRWYDESNS